MTVEEIVQLRRNLQMTQRELAEQLGMNIRSWQEVEAGKTKIKEIHELALERVALRRAAETDNPSFMPAGLKADALKAVAPILENVNDTLSVVKQVIARREE
ncbi:hypothetical protein [Hansschlegelia plantiphila]|uniref:Uncharacterized protein n=1 Tax=Hansschlegelia plantiphila TaxID=374655 RepID=A0A9W6J4H0_9HYPH|nr:hypothetical protein [Hansschlegelia plantiphila]GLK69194.1 hypothetical protein GCM10008179_28320 [Hansschlegelia plantiphila]